MQTKLLKQLGDHARYLPHNTRYLPHNTRYLPHHARYMLLPLHNTVNSQPGDVDQSHPLKPEAPSTQAPGSSDGTLAEGKPDSVGQPTPRVAFLRQVFGIVTCQLLLTAAVSALCMYNPAVRGLCVAWSEPILYATLTPSFACVVALIFVKDKSRWNEYIVWGITGCVALALGSTLALFQSVGLGDLVLAALGITGSFCGLLTAITFRSAVDFRFMGTFLSIGQVLVVGYGLQSAMFGFTVHALFPFAGALLFGGWLLFDMYMVLDRHGLDNPYVSALNLYLDVVTLFLFILRILLEAIMNVLKG